MALVGLGLRAAHFDAVLVGKPKLSCFEVLADNYLHADSPALQKLSQIRANYDFVAHGVGLSIGSADVLNFDYLRRIRDFLLRFDIQNYSDHLCFVSSSNTYVPELLPLILNEASLEYVIARVQQVQDFLARPLILENISQYLLPEKSSLSELEFLNQVCAGTGAKILLDVNNLWVNAHNHHFSLTKILSEIEAQHIAYLHLGGYEQFEHIPKLLVDTHGAAIHDQVWDFYAQVLHKLGPRLTIIERDHHLPELDVLIDEVRCAEKLQNELAFNLPVHVSSFSTLGLTCEAPLELRQYQQEFFQRLSGVCSDGFSIYQSSIYASLVACLKKTYRPLNALIGEACFDALTQEFVRQSWPSDPVLDVYGLDFSEFIYQHSINFEIPYLADYVVFLALMHSQFLLAPQIVTSHELNLEHPEALSITRHEHLTLLRSDYPLDLIHDACLQNATTDIHMNMDDYYFCFIKQIQGLMRYQLSASQHFLLTLLSKFSNFMLVCERYLEQFNAGAFISDIEFLAQHQLILIKETS